MEPIYIIGSLIATFSLLFLIGTILLTIVNRIRKRPLKRLIISSSLLLVAFMLGIVIILTNTPSPESTPDSIVPAANEVAQVWQLTNEGGDVVTVTVSPFTNSGTFTETNDSAGWFVRMPGLSYRLHVGGNIVHTSGGDRWSFVGLTGGAGNAQTLGQGEGTANGQFPNATAVSGTLTLTTQTPIGTQTGTANWWGTRKE